MAHTLKDPKRWALRKVLSVRFTKSSQRHLVSQTDHEETVCRYDIPGNAALPGHSGEIEKVALAQIGCETCLRRSGFIPVLKGSCLVGKSRKTHLIQKRDGELHTPDDCGLNFTGYERRVKKGKYADVHCQHCFWHTHENPWV